MNQSAYSQMISCFISIYCHISNSYCWLHVVRREPLNLSELVSLLIVPIISLCTQKYLCRLCGGGFEQAKIFIKGGYHLLSKRGIMGKADGYRPILLKIGDYKHDEEIVWWLQNSKFCSMK